jgi:hypothetical protein
MTTLTTTGTFTIGDGTLASASTTLRILPASGVGSGPGRLIHPDLGTYDYPRSPDQWVNVDGDVIIPPVWASAKTLKGASNTLFQGDIRDVLIEEHWVQTLAMDLAQARMLIAMWQNPPDPADGFVEWYPSYANDLGFQVVMLDLSIGQAGGQTFTPLVKNGSGYVRGPVKLKMRIVDRA